MCDEMLPVSLVAEVVFCPRNFYYRACEKAEGTNKFTIEGSLQDARRQEREIIKTKDKLQIREITLSSDKLGIIAELDAVEEGRELYPIEYKRGELKENLHDDVQVCLQAMLLEEQTGFNIPFGYIYYSASKTRRRVEFNEELRETSLKAIEKAREILYKGEIPEPVADNRCFGCSLFSTCLPFEVATLNKGEIPSVENITKQSKRIIPKLYEGRILYVDEYGAYIKKSGNKLIVTKEGKTLQEIPATYISQIVLKSKSNISSQALTFLLRMNIEIIYLTSRGRFEGRFAPEENKNSLLKIAQYKSYIDDEFTLNISKKFVYGKLANMRTILMRHNREKNDKEIEKTCKEIKIIMDQLNNIKDKNELLGFEGIATRYYFKEFGKLINQKNLGFNFEKRTKRPPLDPVNALLSFGYSLLVSNVVSSLSIVGLDPYIGFFHSTKYGRPALALDLMEEFRPVIVDSLVISIINKGMVRDKDFKEKFGGIYLEENVRDTFFRAYGEKIKTEIVHPVFNYTVSYIRIFEIQGRLLAKLLTGEIKDYQPFTVR